ncbi:MAG: o-succinylbenzoate synthase [Chloroflexi bacterium]|nr:o-succinylbenzoate synthase [Chloroflexota bacterium]
MKIVGMAWQGYALPFRRPYVTSQGQATMKYGLLVTLLSEEGVTGIGEGSPVGPGSLAEVAIASTLLEDMAPSIVSEAFFRAEEMLPDLTALVPMPCLAFGLETAYLDLLGKTRGKSMSDLLGWRPQEAPINAVIASESSVEAAREATEAVSQEFSSLKIKVGQGLATDLALLSAVRDAVGHKVKLRADANGIWSISQAIETIKRLAAFGLEYVEQPVAATDLAGMAEVRRSVHVPIAADEALRTVKDAEGVLGTQAADIFIIKAARLGGIRPSLQAVETAERAGKQSVITSSLESGIGLAASAHLASALGAHPFAHGLGTGLLYHEDLLEIPLLPMSGKLATPQGPGLGVVLDRGQLRKYAIDIKGGIGLPSLV